MKHILFTLLFMAFSSSAIALDRETEMEFRRLNQLVEGALAELDDQQIKLHQIQRENGVLKARNEELEERINVVNDGQLKVVNVTIPNLQAGQQKLYDLIATTLDWGAQQRGCTSGAVHQQIKAIQSENGEHTLRYLCFDGRMLHLSTEVHLAPTANNAQ